jgi:hypothetical protein
MYKFIQALQYEGSYPFPLERGRGEVNLTGHSLREE